jgi:hypothetical protein
MCHKKLNHPLNAIEKFNSILYVPLPLHQVMWLLTEGKKDNMTPRREELNYRLYAITFNNNSLYVYIRSNTRQYYCTDHIIRSPCLLIH